MCPYSAPHTHTRHEAQLTGVAAVLPHDEVAPMARDYDSLARGIRRRGGGTLSAAGRAIHLNALSTLAAQIRSFIVTPPALCVEYATVQRL